jgi:hypothetical protein
MAGGGAFLPVARAARSRGAETVKGACRKSIVASVWQETSGAREEEGPGDRNLRPCNRLRGSAGEKRGSADKKRGIADGKRGVAKEKRGVVKGKRGVVKGKRGVAGAKRRATDRTRRFVTEKGQKA